MIDLETIFGSTLPTEPTPPPEGTHPDSTPPDGAAGQQEHLPGMAPDDPLADTPPPGWVRRPDAAGRIGWERCDVPDSTRWWARTRYEDLPTADPLAELAAELRRRHPVPGDVCAVETPADWSADLASWALTLAPGDLPPAPIDFRPGHTILDAARFLGRLQADVRSGPAGPRARFGALQGDLAQLHRLLSSHQRSTHQEHRPAGTACDTGEKHPPRPAGDKGRPAGAMG